MRQGWAKQKRPRDIRGALEQRALDLGRVFVVLQVPPSCFEDGVTQPMPPIR